MTEHGSLQRPPGVKIEAQPLETKHLKEIVGVEQLPQKISEWGKAHEDGIIIIEIGSKSNNRDNVILHSVDELDEAVLVVHIDNGNTGNEQVVREDGQVVKDQDIFIVPDKFDQNLAEKISQQHIENRLVTTAIGLTPVGDIETEILQSIKELNPDNIFIRLDTNSADRSLHPLKKSQKNIKNILSNDYQQVDDYENDLITPLSSVADDGQSEDLYLAKI